MVRWSDLGAGLHASPRVALRWELWREVLRRLLLSRVFLAYALAALVLYAGADWLGQRAQHFPQSLVVLTLGGPWMALLAVVLLLPFAWWAFNPAAARLLSDYLNVPLPQVPEPPFRQYLWWTLPTLGLVAALAFGYLLPPLQQGVLAFAYPLAGGLLVMLVLVKLFARSALAAHYARPDIDRFLAVSRLQRLLLWLPVALALALAGDWVAHQVAEVLRALAPQVGLVVQALLQLAVTLVLAIAFVGALLLACGRLVVPVTESGHSRTAIDTRRPRAYSETRPMTRQELQALRNAWRLSRAGRRRAPLTWAALALAAMAISAFLARGTLTDWYFSQDPLYAGATRALSASKKVAAIRLPSGLFDPTDSADRLRAGFIVYGCEGALERAQWIRRLGIPRSVDEAELLTCAACHDRRDTVEWLLAAAPGVQLTGRVLGERNRPTNALACAVRNDDLVLARLLLQRGLRPRDLPAPDSAIDVAARHRRWPMLQLLLREDPGAVPAATFATLDELRTQNPAAPAELLPVLLRSGLSLAAMDEQGRTVLHWAAWHHDLRLARAVLARPAGKAALSRADRHGALPWTLVLRRAESKGQPLDDGAAELLRLLAPPEGLMVDAAQHVAAR